MFLIFLVKSSFICLLVLLGIRTSECNTDDSDTPSPELLEVLTLDNEGSVQVNDKSSFELERTGLFKNTLNYVFKTDSKCVSLKYEGNTFWLHNPRKDGGSFPKRVEFNPNLGTTYVIFDTFVFCTFHFRYRNWEFSQLASSGYTSEYKPVDEELEDKKEKTEVLEDEVKEEQEKKEEVEDLGKLERSEPSDDYSPNLSGYLSESSRSSTPSLVEDGESIKLPVYTVVTVNDDETFSENDDSNYDLTRKDMVVTTLRYKFKEGTKCVELRKGDKTIWKQNDFHRGEYPKSLFYNSQTRRLFVNFHD